MGEGWYRLGITIGGYLMGGYIGGSIGAGLGGLAGMYLGNMLWPHEFGMDSDIQLPSSGKYSTVSGFVQTTLSTQVKIPVVFGKTMIAGNFVSAITLGEGNLRLLSAICLGEGPLTLYQIYVSGVKFEQLSNYSAARVDNKSWYEFYSDGQKSTIAVSNNGTKRIGISVYQGQSHTSYAIKILGSSAQISFKFQHWSPAAGSTMNWTIKGKRESDPEDTFATHSRTFREYIEYSYEVCEPASGCEGVDCHEVSERVPVEGVTETGDSFTLDGGEWVFTLEVNNATNNGYIIFDAVVVSNDPGKELTYNYNKTSYCLINIYKTGAIVGANFYFLVSGLTDNPATALRLILEDTYFGLGVSYEVDGTSFDSAAAWCDTKGYKINLAFTGASYGDAFGMIMRCGRLLLIRTGGMYKCIPEEDSSVVMSFDESTNILPGTLSWGFLPEDRKFNRLKIRYSDEEENYTLQELILDDITQMEEDGYIKEANYDLAGVTSMVLAGELGWMHFKKIRYVNIWIQFEIGLKDAYVEIGDIIEVTSSKLGFSSRKFRIIKVDEKEAFGFKIYAAEHYSEIYDPDLTINNWHPEPFEPPDLGTLGPPYVHIDSIDTEIIIIPGGYQAKGVINYTVPTDPEFDHIELWVKAGYSDIWEFVRIDSSGSVIYFFPETYVDYELKLITVAPDGDKTDFNLSPSTYFYPMADLRPGFGGGRFGVQPFG